MKHSEEKVIEVIKNIAEKMNFSKRIKRVEYRGGFLHYRVEFDDNSSSTIPRKHIDDYIDSGGKEAGSDIETCLSTSVKSL